MIPTLIRLITGVQARWVGQAPDDAASRSRRRIFFANHTSNLDGPVVWASLPAAIRRRTRPVAARDYWEKGPVRRYLAERVFNCMLIERKAVSRSNNPLADMQKALEEGASLIIFPEGGRMGDEDGNPGPFKPGLFHLAKKCPDVQLVPVYLENLNRILPKGELILVPLLATARFGEPISLDDSEDKAAFLERARAAVIALKRAGVANA